MIFNKNEWVHLGQWVQPTLSACFWNNWAQQNNKYPFQIARMDGRLLFLDGHQFVKKSNVGILRKFVQENTENFELLKILEKWVDKVHNSCKAKISLKFDNLVDYIKNMKEVCNDVVNPWIFFIVLDRILEDEIKSICTKIDYNFEQVLHKLRPIRKSFTVLQLEEASLLHRKIKGKGITNFDINLIQEKFPQLAEEIRQHVKRFEFVGMHHFVGEPYSIERFFQCKSVMLFEERKREIIKELKWHVGLASIAGWARTHMAETSGLIQYIIKPILLKVNEALNMKDDDYIWLTTNELINGLENPSKFTNPNIALRKQKLGIYSNENGEEIVIQGKDVDMPLENLLEKNLTSFPLRGRIASTGKVIGTVRIVIRPDDITKVKDGDILIAPETSPDFIVGLKKAIGVITNQGGITSHAAIVSMELGIPCLVGVKGATSIIKDGQRIELDAIKGEVRSVD